LIHNLLDAGDTEVVEIMTPRTRMAFINATMPVAEILDRVRSVRHSRVPVFSDHRDNLLGFVHAEDVLRLVLDKMDLRLLNVDDIVHPPVVVPPTKKVDEMFDFFQKRQCRAAVVLNEFGGVEGFVTITDVLNFIFSQIAGQSHGQELHRDQDQDDYEVPGDMKLVDFNRLTHFGLEDPRMTTIAGIAFRRLDGLPRQGDVVVLDDLELTVLEMDAHRIDRLRVRRVANAESIEESQSIEDMQSSELPESAEHAEMPEVSRPERARANEVSGATEIGSPEKEQPEIVSPEIETNQGASRNPTSATGEQGRDARDGGT